MCIYNSKGLSSYKNFVKLTQDEKWIGLYIFQCLGKCIYISEPIYTCKGVIESGKTREVKEGKKYSPSAYNYSKKNGEKYFRLAPGGRFKIHNSGGKTSVIFVGKNLVKQSNKSTITEYCSSKDETLFLFPNKQTFKLIVENVNKDIKKEGDNNPLILYRYKRDLSDCRTKKSTRRGTLYLLDEENLKF